MRWIPACCLLLLGCAGVPTKPARIAHSCPNVPSRGDRARSAYIELASIKKGDLPRSLAKLKQEPVQAQHVTGVLAEHEVPVALEWNRCLDRECKTNLKRTLLIAAYLPSKPGEAIRIDVMIREGVGEHASVYNERVETRDQTPVSFDEHGERSRIVATPYLLSDDVDVKRLTACKQ